MLALGVFVKIQASLVQYKIYPIVLQNKVNFVLHKWTMLKTMVKGGDRVAI